MANEQVNIPSLLVILLLSGLIVRYLFFSSPAGSSEVAGGRAAQRRQRGVNGGGGAAETAAREAAAERILQMFPQMDRRTVLWDLQRGGGSIAATTERILAGRMETVSGFLILVSFLCVFHAEE
jgi:coupling of ubiquitin conjugation to ER degradation protein 1